jgi:branched-chain amino acid transport system permease protein
MLPILITSIVSGSLYALAAIGLVVTYRSSGVFNFAHGAIGMFIAYCYWYFTIRHHWPVLLAMVVSILVIAPIIGIGLERLFRPLKEQPLAVSLVVTLGVLSLFKSLAVVLFGPGNERISPLLPNGGVRVGGVRVTYDQLLVIGLVILLSGGLTLFLRRTPAGRRMRAAIDNRTLTELSGVSANATARLAWVIGISFAGLAGVLLSEFIGLDVNTLTLVVIAAFSAAMLGRLESLPLAVLGGFIIALGENYLSRYSHGSFVGIYSSWSFLLLFVVLILYRNRLPKERKVAVDVDERLWRPQSRRYGLASLGVGLLVLLALPRMISSQRLFTVNALLIYAVILLSLVILTGYSGQISLAQASFVGIGAFTAGHLSTRSGSGFLLALLLAAAIAAPASLLIGIPSLRLSGLFLALATMAFALMMDNFVFQINAIAGGLQGITVNAPQIFGIDFSNTTPFYYLCLFFLLLFGAFAGLLRRSRYGRRLQALRDAPDGLTTLGVNLALTKISVFAITAAIAAMGGVLLGIYQVEISPDSFNLFASISFLVAAVIGGIGSVPGAVLGGFILAFPQLIQTSSGTFNNYFALGIGLAVINLAAFPNGLISYYRRQFNWLSASLTRKRPVVQSVQRVPGLE